MACVDPTADLLLDTPHDADVNAEFSLEHDPEKWTPVF